MLNKSKLRIQAVGITLQGGKAARKTKHLLPTGGDIPTGGEEKSAAGGELPVAVTRQGTASGSIRGKRKAQVRLPTCARKCTRTGLTVGVPGGAKEGPPKPKRPPRRPPSTGTATEGEKDPSPEAVRGSAEEAAEPMEEAPAERPKGREEPARAERALQVDPLSVTKETSEAGPDSTTEGPAAAEVAEGVQEGPPTEQLPRAPPSSNGDTGPETCVAEEGVMAEPAPEAGVDSADNAATRGTLRTARRAIRECKAALHPDSVGYLEGVLRTGEPSSLPTPGSPVLLIKPKDRAPPQPPLENHLSRISQFSSTPLRSVSRRTLYAMAPPFVLNV
ncbi:UNVERIFIED_CONTAM: hypothetical protein FKN15_020473 [Acipenser sinensis]